MSNAPSKANPAIAILIMILFMLGSVSGSQNISNNDPNASDQGVDNQYSTDNYTYRNNPGNNGEKSFGWDVQRGTMMSTSQPTVEGYQFDNYAFGRNSIQTDEGMRSADNSWSVLDGAYSNLGNSYKAINASIGGGNNNGATLSLGWSQYDYNPGAYDTTGADVTVNWEGLYDNPLIPLTSGSAANIVHTLKTGETGTCGATDSDGDGIADTDVDNQCFMDGWELILPLCEASNCTGALLDTTVDDLLTSITTNSVVDAGTYTGVALPSNKGGTAGQATFVSVSSAITSITVTSSGRNYQVGDTITIPIGTIDASQVDAIVITLAADDLLPTHDTSLYVGNGIYGLERVNWGVSTNSVDTNLVYSFNEIFGTQPFTLQVKECEDCEWITMNEGDTRSKTGKFEYNIQMVSGTNLHYTSEQATPISGFTPSASGCDDTPMEDFKCGSVPTDTSIYVKGGSIIFSVSVGDLTTHRNATTLDFVQYDPSVNFWDNMNTLEEQAGAWKIGVDRDGCGVYQYPCSTGNGGWSIGDDYAEYEIGDGWCGDNSVSWSEGNAGCRFSGLTTSFFGIGSDNWNSQSWNAALSGMPVWDTSPDFDGMVISAEIDKNAFLSQGQTGWFDMAIELGLQTPGYTDGAWSPGVFGDGGWFESCFNGYVDVYIMPENVWEYWYQDAQYGYNKFNDPALYGTTWDIKDDGDWLSDNEYWYDYGQTAGAGTNSAAAARYQFPHSQTSYDQTDAKYWANPNWLSGSGNPSLTNADMKVNQWHQLQNPDEHEIFDDEVETGWLSPSMWDMPGTSGHADTPEFRQSTFEQINDFWDINMYDDEDYDSTNPPLGGQVAWQDSGLSLFHTQTIRLGTSTTDFCYDPITGSPHTRLDPTGTAIDPQTHLKQDSVSGESVLNIPIDYASLFASAATSTETQLKDDGWLDSLGDSTLGMTILVDVRNYDGPQNEVCYGDWSIGTNEINDISSMDEDFCLDKYGGLPAVMSPANYARDNVAWQDFSSETPCKSNEPQSGQQPGQNPDRAFWCGLNFDSPFSDWENIRIKMQTQGYVAPTDTDGDGVADSNDLCPGTPLVLLQVDDGNGGLRKQRMFANGCSEKQEAIRNPQGSGNNAPDPTNVDSDGDLIYNVYDKCDGYNNAVPDYSYNPAVGGASDNSWYITPDSITGITPKLAWETTGGVVDNSGCPTRGTTGGGGTGGGTGGTTNSQECVDFPDIGQYPWEDDDQDSQIDEDWFDFIDNDNDGKIDEDRIDDCPFDNIVLTYDALWPGTMSIGSETYFEGNWQSSGGAAIAENGTGVASNNSKFVMGSNSDNWYETYANASASTNTADANAILVADDGWATERFTCSAAGTDTANTQIAMRVYVFTYLDGTIGEVSVASPYEGDNNLGKWVPYGSAHFDGAAISTNYGWASNTATMSNVHSTTALNGGGSINNMGIVATNVQHEVVMGEGYYKVACTATIPSTLESTGQVINIQGYISTIIVAVEPCDIGETRDSQMGECYVQTTGGGSLGDQGVAFWDALIGSAVAIGVMIIFIALSALLWFIEKKNGAIGVAIMGVGIAAAFFVNVVEVEESTANLWGTLAHLLIAAGVISAFWPYNDEPGKVAAVSAALGFWGLLHVIAPALGGLEEYYVPAIAGIPIIVTVIGLALALFAAAVQFQLVDDPTGILEEKV